MFHLLKKKGRFHLKKWRAFVQMFSHFLSHVRNQSAGITLSLVIGVGYSILGILEPWPIKVLFDRVFLDYPFLSYDKKTMLYLIMGVIIIIGVIRAVLFYYQQLLTSRTAQEITSGIRLDLYDHLQRLSFSFHDRRKRGDLVSRLTTDVRILRDILITLPLSVTTDLFLMIAMIVVLVFMDVQLTLVTLLAIPLLAIFIKKYRFPMKQAMRKQRERESHLASIASEVLGAVKIVQGYHQESYEVSKFGTNNKKSLKSGLKATRMEAKLRWTSELSVAIVTALVLGVAGRRVLLGALSPGDLIVFTFYLRAFSRPLRRASRFTEHLSRATASGERILDLMRVESDVIEKPDVRVAPSFRGNICYQEVCFQYNSSRLILDHINLEVKPGERVAIMGHTGCGKSTLVSLLPRFYDCTSGVVMIDGVDIKEWTLHSLRKQIAILFQEPVLFATSIYENIAYGKSGASKEQIIDASKKAGIHHIIERLPQGYETVLGERGGTLSGGQRQCVAIARAIIKDAPILILDEPTTGLDLPSAHLVMEAVKELMVGKTVVMISHQEEMIQYVDRVIKMSRKKIIREMETCGANQ